MHAVHSVRLGAVRRDAVRGVERRGVRGLCDVRCRDVRDAGVRGQHEPVSTAVENRCQIPRESCLCHSARIVHAEYGRGSGPQKSVVQVRASLFLLCGGILLYEQGMRDGSESKNVSPLHQIALELTHPQSGEEESNLSSGEEERT